MKTPDAPTGLRVQFADGSERAPDAVLYGGKTRWYRRPRLDRWEVYVIGSAAPSGFTADRMPGRCSITFHVRYLVGEVDTAEGFEP
jgi:hypothetical protein